MSADNWKTCPRCVNNGKKEIERAEQAMIEAYGNVPVGDYEELRAKHRGVVQKAEHPGQTLREDYDFVLNEAGTLFVTYSGHCGVCGFHIEMSEHYHHDVSANI